MSEASHRAIRFERDDTEPTPPVRTRCAEAFELARVAAAAADAKKADNVIAIDVTGLSDVSDALVICTGGNARLADSVVEEVETRVRETFGLSPLSVEGRGDGRWILIDYGEAVIHVFSPDARDYYRLERLWGDAPRIDVL